MYWIIYAVVASFLILPPLMLRIRQRNDSRYADYNRQKRQFDRECKVHSSMRDTHVKNAEGAAKEHHYIDGLNLSVMPFSDRSRFVRRSSLLARRFRSECGQAHSQHRLAAHQRGESKEVDRHLERLDSEHSQKRAVFWQLVTVFFSVGIIILLVIKFKFGL